VPPILPRFVVLPDGERFVPLEQLIAAHLGELFPGMEIVANHPFRVTRNADIEIDEDEESGDLLLTMESELTRRRFGKVVRLEVPPDLSADLLDLLLREMGATVDQVYRVEGPLDLGGLLTLTSLPRDDLKYEPFNGVNPSRLWVGSTRTSSKSSRTVPCWSSTLTTPSAPRPRPSSRPQPATRRSLRSSKRCTEPAATAP
jgi:polyphosphate kinase